MREPVRRDGMKAFEIKQGQRIFVAGRVALDDGVARVADGLRVILVEQEPELAPGPTLLASLLAAAVMTPQSALAQNHGDLTGQIVFDGDVPAVEIKIKKGDRAANGMVDNPDKVIKMQMKSDAG